MDKKTTDIVLIQLPGWSNQNPPMGLALLKSYLAGRGFNARVFDLNIVLYNLRHGRYSEAWNDENAYYLWERESFVKQMFNFYSSEILNFIYSILSLKPAVVGFSTHCSSFISARLLARKIRQYLPETKIVFGGPQVASYTDRWKEILLSGEADAVVFGEGEESLSEYLKSRNSLSKSIIKGVAHTVDGQIIDGGDRTSDLPLDSLPFADFSDFDLKMYAGENVLPTYFSRGCINRCVFCTERKFSPRFRNRSGKRVFDEIVHQLSVYPQTQFFRFHDSVSNANVKELERFCDLLIENKINIGFNLENAVIRKEMDAGLYRKLKKAGCTVIGYGMETPSKQLLKSIGKKACLDADFDKVVKEGVRAKLIIGINMMFGLLGETRDDFQQQLDFLKRFKRYRKHMIVNPSLNYCYFPEGCEVYMDPDKYGVDISKGSLFWVSKDGENTFIDRQKKFEEYCSLAQKLGFINLFNVIESANKNELLGDYYYSQGEYERSLDYLKRSFEEETRTLELAESILDIYRKQSLVKDEMYEKVSKFRIEDNADVDSFVDTLKTRRELDEFILTSSISDTLRRFSSFADSSAMSPAKFHLSFGGIKRYVKYRLLKLLHMSDRRHFIQFQLIKLVENKVDAMTRAKEHSK